MSNLFKSPTSGPTQFAFAPGAEGAWNQLGSTLTNRLTTTGGVQGPTPLQNTGAQMLSGLMGSNMGTGYQTGLSTLSEISRTGLPSTPNLNALQTAINQQTPYKLADIKESILSGRGGSDTDLARLMMQQQGEAQNLIAATLAPYVYQSQEAAANRRQTASQALGPYSQIPANVATTAIQAGDLMRERVDPMMQYLSQYLNQGVHPYTEQYGPSPGSQILNAGASLLPWLLGNNNNGGGNGLSSILNLGKNVWSGGSKIYDLINGGGTNPLNESWLAGGSGSTPLDWGLTPSTLSEISGAPVINGITPGITDIGSEAAISELLNMGAITDIGADAATAASGMGAASGLSAEAASTAASLIAAGIPEAEAIALAPSLAAYDAVLTSGMGLGSSAGIGAGAGAGAISAGLASAAGLGVVGAGVAVLAAAIMNSINKAQGESKMDMIFNNKFQQTFDSNPQFKADVLAGVNAAIQRLNGGGQLGDHDILDGSRYPEWTNERILKAFGDMWKSQPAAEGWAGGFEASGYPAIDQLRKVLGQQSQQRLVDAGYANWDKYGQLMPTMNEFLQSQR